MPAPRLSREASSWCGALAQLGEHLLCKQGVSGSIPLGSTSANLVAMFRDGSPKFSRYEEPQLCGLRAVNAGFARIFDIVNGFLIDAATKAAFGSSRAERARVAQSG